MKRIGLRSVITLLAGCVAGAAAAGESAVETRSGQAIMIAGYTSTTVQGAFCSTGALPRVTVASPPANGAVTIRRVANVDPGEPQIGTGYKCAAGFKTAAVLAIYTPRKGFRGSERIGLNVAVNGAGLYPMTLSETVTVTVK